ncbi:MAG: SH3 domain-containing protein [Chloroflexota bacterium]
MKQHKISVRTYLVTGLMCTFLGLVVLGCEGGELSQSILQEDNQETARLTTIVTLNVRSGPGTTYERIGQLTPETTLLIVGKNEDSSWWQIIYPADSDQTGWISASPDFGNAISTDDVRIAEIPPTPIVASVAATPIPTVTPSLVSLPSTLGKTTLILHTRGIESEFLIQNQKYHTDGQQPLVVEVEPGKHDVVFVYRSGTIRPPKDGEPTMILDWAFKLDLVADHVCELHTVIGETINEKQDGFRCDARS